jgi:outer membrane protein OmpA-like peptidoglycan-associated protein
MHHLARLERTGQHAKPSAVASATQASAGPDTIEHPSNLGPSFTSLPPLPGAAPPLPAPPPASPAPPKPAETASAAPKPVPVPVQVPMPKPAAAAPAPPPLALPTGVPPPTAAPTRLAEATPGPPAALPAPPPPHAPTPNALPKGADRLTLPFFVNESDLPPAENAMLRDFAQRYGTDTQYIIRAFASPPAGDDDPSTPRRISLERAQSVAAALTDSGVQPDRLRLLALGNAGGAPADRVDVIAMPPSSGHTHIDTDSSP